MRLLITPCSSLFSIFALMFWSFLTLEEVTQPRTTHESKKGKVGIDIFTWRSWAIQFRLSWQCCSALYQSRGTNIKFACSAMISWWYNSVHFRYGPNAFLMEERNWLGFEPIHMSTTLRLSPSFLSSNMHVPCLHLFSVIICSLNTERRVHILCPDKDSVHGSTEGNWEGGPQAWCCAETAPCSCRWMSTRHKARKWLDLDIRRAGQPSKKSWGPSESAILLENVSQNTNSTWEL